MSRVTDVALVPLWSDVASLVGWEYIVSKENAERGYLHMHGAQEVDNSPRIGD